MVKMHRMMKLQSTEEEVYKIFSNANTDREGLIDFHEFTNIVLAQKLAKTSVGD